MESPARHSILIERSMELINDGHPLVDAYLEGDIKIIINRSWNREVVIDNCIVENFEGSVTQFDKPVKFTNSHFKNCTFVFSYFKQGLLIDNCTFDKYLDFQAGGHNKIGYPVIIRNNKFIDFVNFFDCWYNGEVFVCNNEFGKGTNIESQQQLITFDIPPVIASNIGLTTIEAEFVE